MLWLILIAPCGAETQRPIPMKKLLTALLPLRAIEMIRTIGAILAALEASPAAAQIFDQSQQQTFALDLFCPMTARITAQDKNPALGAEINGEARDHQMVWLEITYTLLDGSKVRRSDQYVNTRTWVADDKNIFWTGTYTRDHHRRIEGRITADKGAIIYSERHFNNSVQEEEMITPCMKAIDVPSTSVGYNPL
jgi:hypothetical protein